MAESSGIDFVITWVDGADPAWRRERNSYASDGGFGCSEARFRDWGLLRYWFRGVERFAPWVHLAKGEYFCGAPDECRCAHLTASNAARWAQSIRAREYTVVCANDNALLDEFETTRGVIAAAFAAVFPDRCSFEREDAP